MPFKTRLTLAVSIIAMAASGPLAAQPFPNPDAQPDQPWPGDGLASEPTSPEFLDLNTPQDAPAPVDTAPIFEAPQDIPSVLPDQEPADVPVQDPQGWAPESPPEPQFAPELEQPQPAPDTNSIFLDAPLPEAAPEAPAFDPQADTPPAQEPGWGSAAEPAPDTDNDPDWGTTAVPDTQAAPAQEPDWGNAAEPQAAEPRPGMDDAASPSTPEPLILPDAAPESQAPDAGLTTPDLSQPNWGSAAEPTPDTGNDPTWGTTAVPETDAQPQPDWGSAAEPQTDEPAPESDPTVPETAPVDPALDSPAPGTDAGAPEPTAEPAVTTPEQPTDAPEQSTDTPETGQEPDAAMPALPGEAEPTEPQAANDPAPAPTPVSPQDAPVAISPEVQATIQADPVIQESVSVLENSLDGPPLAAAGTEPGTAPVTRTIEDTRNAADEFDGRITAAPTAAAPVGSGAEAQAREERRREEERRDREARRDRLESAGLGAIAGLVVGAIIADRQEVVATAPERVVVVDRSTNVYQVWRDDDSILRRPGLREESTVYPDGSVRTVLYGDDGYRVETIRNATGRVLKRERVYNDRRVVIVDDLRPVRQVDTRVLPPPRIPRVFIPRTVDPVVGAQIVRESSTAVNRTFSLGQVRNIWEVRRLVPVLDTDPVLFATGSSALTQQQAAALSGVASVMIELLRQNPGEIFLVEGHTDAVGSAASNLALSDRRAETIAQALVDYFRIPPANLVFQGYGESLLAVNTPNDEPRNRRVEIRRITPLLQPATR